MRLMNTLTNCSIECHETLSFSPLSKKVELLGREFSPSDVFPPWFLVEELEKLNSKSPQNASEEGISWVFETMRRVGIPFGTLFEIYSSFLDSNVRGRNILFLY